MSGDGIVPSTFEGHVKRARRNVRHSALSGPETVRALLGMVDELERQLAIQRTLIAKLLPEGEQPDREPTAAQEEAWDAREDWVQGGS